MPLVMIAVVVAMGLGLTLLSSSQTIAPITANANAYAQARLTATAGAHAAIHYLHAQPDWPDEHHPGLWIDAQPYGQGAFTTYIFPGNHPSLEHAQQHASDTWQHDTPLTIFTHAEHANTSYIHRALIHPQASDDFTAGLTIQQNIQLGGTAGIMGFDPATGQITDARVSTNATQPGSVSMDWSTFINGDLLVGPGADPQQVLDAPHAHGITGELGNIEHALSMAAEHAPDGLGPYLHDYTWPHGQHTESNHVHANDLAVQSNTSLHMQGDRIMHVEGDLTLTAGSSLHIPPDGSLTIYVQGDLIVSGNAQVNMQSQDPSRLMIHVHGQSVDFEGSGAMTGRIIAPEAHVQMIGNSRHWGSLHAQSIHMQGSPRLYTEP